MNPVAFLALATAPAAYFTIVRPWQLTWGATREEVAAPMLGDEVVRGPHFVATRAVSIKAPPTAVWPWIAQLGSKRAGFYSIDLLDNGDAPSAERILPQFQQVAAGDFVPMTPDQKHGMWVKDVAPGQYLLWWDKKGSSTWLWQLLPTSEGTRLTTRLTVRYSWTLPWVIYYLLQEVGGIVMMAKCMLGIKQRAEREHATKTSTSHAPRAFINY
jgi:hypothetical protein